MPRKKEYLPDIEQERIKEHLEYWQGVMALGWCAIKLTFIHDIENPDIAETSASFKYREADMQYNTARTTKMGGAELDAVVVHELAHVLLAPLGQYIPDRAIEVEEFTASSIANAITSTQAEFEGL